MYFYVDESGHTGAALFDPNQPMLYYGVLSSPVDIEAVATTRLAMIQRRHGVERVHASVLGNGGLAPLAEDLFAIQMDLELKFDIYRVAKPDHAIICFFDQVFDSGMNPAVGWTSYWTPMRYVWLARLASLFDEDIAKQAWAARIETDPDVATPLLVDVCERLLAKLDRLDDERAAAVIGDALRWVVAHPLDISYNVDTPEQRLQVIPNVVGFQTVMHGIARRIEMAGAHDASRIVVDRQTEFNKAQKYLADFFASAKDIELENGPGLPAIDYKNMPVVPITFGSSVDNPGLVLVDIYLWVFKRMMEGKPLADELQSLVASQVRTSHTDEISLRGIVARWSRWFEELPDPTAEQLAFGEELAKLNEAQRQTRMRERK